MKKVMMMIALLAIPFAMQAQTKFHDLEVNDAKGPVAKVTFLPFQIHLFTLLQPLVTLSTSLD